MKLQSLFICTNYIITLIKLFSRWNSLQINLLLNHIKNSLIFRLNHLVSSSPIILYTTVISNKWMNILIEYICLIVSNSLARRKKESFSWSMVPSAERRIKNEFLKTVENALKEWGIWRNWYWWGRLVIERSSWRVEE